MSVARVVSVAFGETVARSLLLILSIVGSESVPSGALLVCLLIVVWLLPVCLFFGVSLLLAVCQLLAIYLLVVTCSAVSVTGRLACED